MNNFQILPTNQTSRTKMAKAVLLATTLIVPAPAAYAQVEEIFVTAQRRQENVQSVPLSVSAIKGDTLEKGGVLDISRLKLLTPGLNFGQTGANSHLAIRGARTEGILGNVQPVVSFYSDGIYRAGTLQGTAPMIDMERVEVLRGPQGTLFGRNSYGGAINMISKRPDQEFDMGASFTVGDYDRRDVTGFINFAITDQLSARMAGSHREHDGYVENTFDRSEDIKDQDDDYFRGALLWEPSERVSLLLRGEYWKQGGNGSADFNYYSPGTPAGNAVFGEATPFNVLGGTLSGDIADEGPYKISRDVDFILDAEQKTVSAELDWAFDMANMKVLVAHTEYENLHTNDIDMGPEANGREGQFDKLNTDQAEVHLTDNGEGSFQWLVGGFYMKEKNLDSFYFECNTSFDCYFANRRNMDNTIWAGFAQVTASAMDDRLRLTGGLRYTDEDLNQRLRSRYGDETFPSDSNLGPTDFRDTCFDAAGCDVYEDFRLNAKFSPVTWRVAVDYDLEEGHMVYASVSTGYSSGGFNAVANPLTDQFIFPEQNVTAYELGSKNTFMDGNVILNVALFYNKFHEILSEPAVDIGATIIYNDVGGDGDAYGMDVEFDWTPTENSLINVRASWLNAKYGSFQTGTGSGLTTGNIMVTPFAGPPDIPFVDVSGRRIAFSPKFTLGVSAEHTFHLATMGTLTPSIQFYYSSDYMTADQYYPFARQDAYTQTDLRLTWRAPNEHVSITGFIQNLEDEAVILRTNIFTASQIGQTFADPKIFGVTVAYRF